MPAALFLGLWARTRRRLALATAGAWLLYLPYAYALKWRVLCTGECNIRVDLLLLHPARAALSIVAVIAATRGGEPRSG